jgi:prepilin-type N-terminal cleavage/methylation domain-containing protein/prepilin-type processing-associated H-X9-DG protein
MRRHGLTLTELILVIAIIAILAALLLPSLQRSRLQAKAVVCMSNIRQLNSAFSVYINDYGKFPYGIYNSPAGAPPDGYTYSAGSRAGWWWFNYLDGIYTKKMRKKTVIQCPSRQINNPKLNNDILCGNYGANLSICRMFDGTVDQNEIGRPRTLTEVPRPAQALLIVDSGYTMISWRHAADFLTTTLGSTNIEDTSYVPGLSINRQRQLKSGQEIDAYYGRHPRATVNIGFADGHAARTSAEDLLVKKTPDGRYENRSPLWMPDSK